MKIARMGIAAVALGAMLSGSALVCGSMAAQEPNPTADPQTSTGIQNGGRPQGEYHGVPLYRVTVEQRDLDAVSYLHRTGSTKIAFRGTSLLPGGRGEAKVDSNKGRINIDAHFDGLTPANGFGPEYLTYVLWAITPDGSPSNLGEVLPSGKDLNLSVTTGLQAFGMIVTAEPYFAVKVPSNVVVLENVIIPDKTNGVLEKVNAKYSLLPRGAYSRTDGSHSVMNPITRDERSPLELYEAHNAVRIAQMAGAEKYSPDILANAMTALKNADDIDAGPKPDRKMEITFAREAVQRSEDARIATLRRKVAEERQAEVDARKAAQAQAAQSAADADAARKAQADAEANAARANAAEADAQKARAEADALRKQAEANAEQAKLDADAKIKAMRAQLIQQLNAILATTETPRGLMVNLTDVLFDTGKYTLKPDTKIALAKVAVIISSHADLKLQVEGYTDIVGGDDYNQKLSENRANAVKDYLISQGVNPQNISSAGYGKSNPVADNGTAAGRQQNRRVEMIVSGPSIGYEQQPHNPVQ